MITKSRVVDTRKPITSRSGVDRAVKARDTLHTAQAILHASGNADTAAELWADITRLSYEITAYYQRQGSIR